ncbi:MAG: GDP-mannose 4,6-dehydratase [Dissulfurimicrobium sp.]|uniref:GDP-mannose 4,6-dehydratase n=1 Tax=Dissulfurimicrobium TaxID=1769732 RepID=UPI001EDB8DA7|nr:GDP-mannose 4,6-dehydratase [Dissulfurimicrobium hydrothermale]UKL13836.1 GDP-mannose 4,6-dehydratase [Dissulfurimicrobium hydrothermale]
MKRALITGIRGQDGAYLAKLLLEKGYEVYGADRRSGDSSNWRLKELGIESHVKIVYMDLLELTNILRTIEKIKPDEVYNLAAQSFVKVSFDQPILTADIDAMGVLRLLEALRTYNPSARFYQASTSEMFGRVQEVPQSEKTPFYPRSPYGVSKLFAHWMTVNYRESYGMFACSGILFNHESPFRGLEFVTRKITHAIAQIKRGRLDKVVVGNLDSKRDWGYAPEYVNAMWRMLQQESPDDYVIATGETHTVREWIECAFKAVEYEIAWEGAGVNEKGRDVKTGKVLVEVSPEYFRPAEVELLIGDASKAQRQLNWRPQTTFSRLLEIMVEADLRRE